MIRLPSRCHEIDGYWHRAIVVRDEFQLSSKISPTIALRRWLANLDGELFKDMLLTRARRLLQNLL